MRTVPPRPSRAHLAPLAPLARFALSLFAVVVPSLATAQPATDGIVSSAAQFDPSIHSAGMGGTSVAVFWLDEPSEWGNPASLGSVRGVRYVHGTTRLSSLALEYDRIRSDRLLLGALGVGVSLAGKPFESLGGVRLEYGPRTVLDGFGNATVVEPYEEVRSVSVGVSVLDFLSTVAPIGFRDKVTLAAGHTWKELVADMGGGLEGEGESADWGALVRVVPVDAIGATLLAPRDALAGRLELSGGYTARNYRDPAEEDFVRVLEREETIGAGGRMTVALPTRIGRGWFWDFATPSLGLGVAWERTEGETPQSGGARYDLIRFGGELTILDIVSLRHGSVNDDDGLSGHAWGAGVSIQYRKALGVRFDWARYPYAEGSDDLDQYAITAFIEPLKFDSSGGLE